MDNNKKRFIEALKKSRGIISSACESVSMSRQTYYNWIDADADFKAAVDEIQESAIDFVESKLMEKINGVCFTGSKVTNGEDEKNIYTLPPSDTAIIFYLKTKGKKRGYVEKTEIEHSGQVSQVTIFELPDNGRDGH